MEAWRLLKQHIDYLHSKDAQPDGTVVPAGKGVGHLREIIAEYYAIGGRALTVEPHLKVFDGLKALEESGNTSVVGGIYRYPDANTAFDAACDAMKAILKEV
jgi:sugar phosphate isomerase/epimerase